MNDRVSPPAKAASQSAGAVSKDPRGLKDARGLSGSAYAGGRPLTDLERQQLRHMSFQERHRVFAEAFRRELRRYKGRPALAVGAAYYAADFYFTASEKSWLDALSPLEKPEGREIPELERRDIASRLSILPPRLSNYDAEMFTLRPGAEAMSGLAHPENPHVTHAVRGGMIGTNAEFAQAAEIAYFEQGPSNQGAGVIIGGPTYLGLHALKKADIIDIEDETIEKASNFLTNIGNTLLDGVASPTPKVRHGKQNRPTMIDVRNVRQKRGIGPQSSSIQPRSSNRPGAATAAQEAAHTSALRSLGAQTRLTPVVPRDRISLTTLPVDWDGKKQNARGAYDFRRVHANDEIIIWNRTPVRLRDGSNIGKGQLNRYIEATRLPYPRFLVLEAPVMLKGSPAPGKSRSGTNSMQFKRDASNYWKMVAEQFPVVAQMLELRKDSGGKYISPKVTSAFADYADRAGNREDIPPGAAVGSWHDFVGVTLEHHHLDNGAFVIASPTTLHKSLHGDIHLRSAVERRPGDARETWNEGDPVEF